MSLLDDVSIVVTPNGYKAGELYAVIPVPTEGAEEITNGDFATDLIGWSNANNYWQWTSQGAYFPETTTHNPLSQTLDNDADVVLKFTFTLNIIKGTVNAFYLNSSSASIQTQYTTSGTYTIYTVPAKANTTITFSRYGGINTEFYVDNVSVKEYTSADMDVTRATAATRVDENGLVNYAEVLGGEEVTNGDFATDTDWIKDTGWTISGGQAHCDGTDGAQFRTVNSPLTDGKTYYISYQITSYNSGSIDVLGQSFYGISGNSVTTVTGIFVATKPYVRFYSSSFTGSIDNVSVKESTKNNLARVDYDGTASSLLAEPERTNLVPESSDFTTWTTTGSAEVTPNTTISPDGTQNADTLNIFSGNFFYKPITSGAGTFTLSCYVKVASGTLDFKMQSFNGTDGADASSTFTANTNWQRFEFTTTVTTDSNFYPIQVSGLTGGDFLIWGAQLEEGSYATSYIPTDGSTVTRVQDQYEKTGISNLINSEEGVLFVEMAALSDDLTYRYVTLSDGTASNRIDIRYNNVSNQIEALLRGSSSFIILTYTATDITNFNKIAFKYKTGDFALWVDGVERAVNSTLITTTGLNKLALDNGGGSQNFFGKVKQLQVYDTALTDTELATLTTI